jgi:O-antigen/teichoic acid export membrane protein
MTAERDSYRRIVNATAVMGGATIAIILIGVVRTKLFALLVGPAGIGLIGLFTSIMATAAAVGGMGLGFSGVREIAASPERRPSVRRALWLATWPLAVLTACLLWLGRFEIVRWSGAGEDQATAIGLIGVPAALTIIAAVQLAEIQGLGRLKDVAKARVGGAVIALLLGVAAVTWLGAIGLVLAVAAIPAANVMAALPFRPRLERTGRGALTGMGDEWRRLLGLGATIMVTSSLSAGVLVIIRALIIHQDGIEAAGLYQAAYGIAALNASLVLSAMATDYFPRLSGTEADRKASTTLVNQQLHAALILASPILLAMSATAPLVLHILYSGEFTAGADLLRWQLTGELLKLPGWAMAFLLIARSDKSRFLLVETSFALLFAGASYVLLPRLGLAGAGVGYAFAYLAYSMFVAAMCSRRHDAMISRQNLLHLLVVGFAMLALALAGAAAPWIAAAIGLVAALASGLYALRHLKDLRPSTKAPPLAGLQPE